MNVETMIDRVDLRARTTPFPRWLSVWATARQDGWDTTVLVDDDAQQAVALACRPCASEDQQLSLLADGAA